MHGVALFWGWLAGMLLGTGLALAQGLKSTFPIHAGTLTVTAYIAVEALIVNLALAAVLTLVFDRAGLPHGADATVPDEYEDPPAGAPSGELAPLAALE
jgi:SSS family solute:Na+ symporter